MIKFIRTTPKQQFFNGVRVPCVEIYTEDDLSIDELADMFCDFARAIGFHEDSVRDVFMREHSCEGCEYIEKASEKEEAEANEKFANAIKDKKLVWVPDPDGDDNSSAEDPTDEIEGTPI